MAGKNYDITTDIFSNRFQIRNPVYYPSRHPVVFAHLIIPVVCWAGIQRPSCGRTSTEILVPE